MTGSPIKVLVVDDSALMRKALRAMLEGAGMAVDVARNGLDALDRIRADAPDVVTLDVNMPEMDGITCLSRIMVEHPLPVVMVSSLTESGARVTLEALELGAVDYVPKPGGTVSLDIDTVAAELVAKVRAASRAKVRRAGALKRRLEFQRSEALVPTPRRRTTSGTLIATPTGPLGAGRDRRRSTHPLPELVLIGSSTGGPSALKGVLEQLPRDFCAPIVIAQHIPASFTKHLAERLDSECAISVVELSGSEALVPGRAYLGQGDADVVVANRAGRLVARSVPADPEYRWHPSVDRLVASALAAVDPVRIVGALLTGMGDDGAAQFSLVKEQGGRTIAESEETAVVWGMPGELDRRGGATVTLPLHRIGEQLADWA